VWSIELESPTDIIAISALRIKLFLTTMVHLFSINVLLASDTFTVSSEIIEQLYPDFFAALSKAS